MLLSVISFMLLYDWTGALAHIYCRLKLCHLGNAQIVKRLVLTGEIAAREKLHEAVSWAKPTMRRKTPLSNTYCGPRQHL